MLTATVLIGLSVIMHVAWNLLARHVSATCNFLWWGLFVHLLLLSPIGFYSLLIHTQWNGTLISIALVTMLANSLYFLSLRQAYSIAPASYVYPLARSSPLLILLWSWLLFDETPSGTALLGIVISIIGLWWLAATGSQDKSTRSALPWVFLAALSTSIYSLSDKVAVNLLPTFTELLGFASLGYLASFALLSFVNFKQTGAVIPACRPAWRYLLPGGLFIGTAYALTIQAMLYLPAAYVVAFTNVGIVLASLLSILWLHERKHWKQRLLAVFIIVIGLGVLSL